MSENAPYPPFPLLVGAPDDVITEELVAAHRDD